MVEKLITFSLRNRAVVLLVSACLFVWGVYSVQQNPIDAIPDLSENQVIVFTEWMGRSPQVIEAQVTYPLVSNLQGIPKVKNIRGASMFGMSFVYIIFEDDVDIYWARTRVLERLNYAQRLLPQNVVPTLGPDGTGVGHVFWYHLNANGMDLGEQRALQDWYVKFALQTVPGVAEVASFGGFEKQYQLVLDPLKMQYYNINIMEVMNANTISAGLKRQVLLQEIMRAFARRLLPLKAFSSVFSGIPLQGTNVVEVPYFPLVSTASTDFVTANGYVMGDSTHSTKTVTVNKRKYQPIRFTSDELTRQPALNLMKIGEAKAEKLAAADDVFGAEREILRRELDGVMATDVTEGFVSVRTRRGVYIVDVLALNGARLASVAILHAWEATQLVGWCGRYLSTALEMLERYQLLPADLSA